MKRKSKHRLIKFIVLLILVFLSFVVYGKYRQYKEIKEWNNSYIPLISENEALKELDIPSDIPGLTYLDKYNMGLDLEDGSDTDKDMISDKDEIENGTDPLKYNEPSDDIKFGGETGYLGLIYYDNIILDIDELGYVDSYGFEFVDNLEFKDYNTIQSFYVYNFKGNIFVGTLEISPKDNWYDPEKLDIIAYDGISYKKIKTKVDIDFNRLNPYRDGLEFDVDLTNDFCYYYLVEKADNNFSINSNVDLEVTDNISGLAYSSPILGLLNIKDTQVYTKLDESSFKSNLLEIFGTDKYELSDSQFFIKEKLFDKYLSTFKYNGKFKINHLAFCYYTFNKNDSGKTTTGFNKFKNEFCFHNINTKYSPSGNCAGMTVAAMQDFKNKLNYSGNFTYNSETIDWSFNEYNPFLSKKSLYEYENEKLPDKIAKNDIDANCEEFIKYITELQFKYNDVSLTKLGHFFGYKRSYDKIERVIEQLDSKNPVYCSFMIGKGGHAVLIYDYEYVDNHLIFKVYDPNAPQDRTQNHLKHINTCAIDIFKKDDKFDFVYCPTNNKNYCTKSTDYLRNSIVFMNEDFKFLE